MRILVLWADDRSPNLGVRALGEGTRALALRVWPEAECVFYNYGPGPPVRIGSPRALLIEAATRRHGLAHWFRDFDLILDTRAGDSFADLYGLRRLVAMSAATEFAHRVKIPIVLTPQTIGPFSNAAACALGRRSLTTASFVMARDSASAGAAEQLGRRPDVLTTDVVFALDVPKPSRRRDVVLNVSGLLWRPGPHVDAESYQRTVAAVYASLVRRGRTVTLLPHVLSSLGTEDDVSAVREFGQRHAPDADIVIPASLAEARQVLAGANLVIGSRMHACLNALSVGVPAIPLAYSRKFGPLLADLGWPHVVDLRSQAERAPELITEMAERPDLEATVTAVLARASASLQHATDALARTALGVT